jgi:prevent-host-death family protein
MPREVGRMTAVTVRDFSYNPSAMFARVEHGEVIEVTRHGRVIAVLSPPKRAQSRYDELVARGLLIPAERTTDQLDQYARIDVPDDVDPLAMLLEMREQER